MKIKLAVLFLAFFFLACEGLGANSESRNARNAIKSAPKMSGVFGGGPFYKKDQRVDTIKDLKRSGFTMVEIWTIHVFANGELNFNAEFPLVRDGEYIGGKKYSDFKNDVASLKQGSSNITKINFGLSGWGSKTFDNIKSLIKVHGTGKSSVLYRNFRALRENFPDVDAIDFDDESTYDLPSATKFGIMLSEIGFKVSIAPYAMKDTFWAPLVRGIEKKRPGTIDAVYLQCYSGGAWNNPGDWQSAFPHIPVYPGLDTNSGEWHIQTRLNGWKKNQDITGGWLWLYDQIPGKAARYAKVIDDVFKISRPGVN